MPELSVIKAQSDILAGISLLYEECYVWYVDIINMNKKVSYQLTYSFMSIIGALAWPAGSQGQSNLKKTKNKNTIKKTKQKKNKSKVGIHREWHRVCELQWTFSGAHSQQNVSPAANSPVGTGGMNIHSGFRSSMAQNLIRSIQTVGRQKVPQIGTKRTTRWQKTGSGLSPHSSSLQRKYLVWCWSQWSWWLDGHVDLV